MNIDDAVAGSFTYTPGSATAEYSDSFEYQVSTADGRSCGSSFTLVGRIPQKPMVFPSYRVTVPAYVPAAPTNIYLPDGYFKPQGITFAFQIVSPPSHGQLGRLVGHSVPFTPDAGYTGTDQFSYQLYDVDYPSLVSDVIKVDVANVPATSRSALSVSSIVQANISLDPAVSSQIVLNGYGAGSLPLVFALVAPPQHGTISLPMWTGGIGTVTPGGAFQTYTATYTPMQSYSGVDQFAYQVYINGQAGAFSNIGVVNLIPSK